MSGGAKGAKKFDQQKARMDLLPTDAITEIAKVLTFGAEKYGERNWELGMSWGRCYAACLRHLFAWWSGEDKDPESGLSHLGHAGCCLLFMLAFHLREVGEDDREVPHGSST